MKKGPQIILAITLSFIFLVAGIYVGRYTVAGTLTVESSKQTTYMTIEPDTDAALGNGKININKASVEEFSLLPGIGETLARRIIAYRDINGMFKTVEDLMNVPGIGEGKMAQIAKYVTVE